MDDEWIGVADVAAELKLTDRAAWELIRRLGVPIIEPRRAVMRYARFRRADWERCRDASMGSATPRVNTRPENVQPARPDTVTSQRQRRLVKMAEERYSREAIDAAIPRI